MTKRHKQNARVAGPGISKTTRDKKIAKRVVLDSIKKALLRRAANHAIVDSTKTWTDSLRAWTVLLEGTGASKGCKQHSVPVPVAKDTTVRWEARLIRNGTVRPRRVEMCSTLNGPSGIAGKGRIGKSSRRDTIRFPRAIQLSITVKIN